MPVHHKTFDNRMVRRVLANSAMLSATHIVLRTAIEPYPDTLLVNLRRYAVERVRHVRTIPCHCMRKTLFGVSRVALIVWHTSFQKDSFARLEGLGLS